MRLYSFVNMYMGGIHAGIQSLHAVSSMWRRYEGKDAFPNDIEPSPQLDMLREWEDDHKTVVLLNGGDHRSLLDLEAFMQSPANPFPWASFNESQDALAGALTAVCVVLPERMYDQQYATATTKPENFIDFEWALYQRRQSCPLAR